MIYFYDNPPTEGVIQMAVASSSSTRQVFDYGDAYPNSRKVYVEANRVRVPMREVSLSGDESPVLLYDTSGTLGVDPRCGLPGIRRDWIAERADVEEIRDAADSLASVPNGLRRPVLKGTGPVTQMHYARRGEITAEMEFVAIREGFDPEFVRSEVARGRAIIPANINHPELEPMAIGRNFLVKINANIGNSAVGSSIDEEVEKLRWGNVVGGRYDDGSVDRREHPRDARMDRA